VVGATAAGKEYLERSIAPQQVRHCSLSPEIAESDEGWVDPPADPEQNFGAEGHGKNTVVPQRAPSSRMPLEFRDLVRVDEETATQSNVGLLRLWVDVMPIGDQQSDEVDVPKMMDFQLRVTIWRITNISVFKDFGDRNDVYVKARFKNVDLYGKETVKVERTDTHKFANTEASFNWRWVFPLRGPARECSLELTMMDEDKISVHDAIYHPQVYSLNHMLSLACSAAADGRRPLGTLQETVVFDRWDDESPIETWFSKYCRCCWRRSGLAEMKFAQMRMDVQILPADEAALSPVEPGQISHPRDRMTVSSAISYPQRTLRIIMGAKNYWCMRYFSSFCFVLILSLLICALIFFIMSIAGGS